ncbi:MAG: hypothetical protein A2033_15315 [Bacteroidetes bacterium GWA2_31_9]|nr:MAG: hypothetical protein A2033_15315 [Bacteroidetes bacterium GWA2_31_9]
MINEFVGWFGSIMLSICAIPQVIHTYKTKKAGDLSWGFLWLWFWGEIFTLIYIVYSDMDTKIYHIPLYMNYVFNTLLVVYLIYAKKYYKPIIS